jgi:hypothetical protein
LAKVIAMLSTFGEGLKGISASIDGYSQQSPSSSPSSVSMEPIVESLKGLEKAINRGVLHMAGHNNDNKKSE